MGMLSLWESGSQSSDAGMDDDSDSEKHESGNTDAIVRMIHVLTGAMKNPIKTHHHMFPETQFQYDTGRKKGCCAHESILDSLRSRLRLSDG
ncbi:hypothetical protein JCM14469_27240 [Desulfatiferula olefinivorans]